MKVEAGLVSLKSKLSKPCRKLNHVFKFRIKKLLSIKSLWLRRYNRTSSTTRALTKPRRAWSWLGWLRRSDKKIKMERVREELIRPRGSGRRSPRAEGSREELLFILSPMRAGGGSSTEEVEDACRSFENYLVEMIIEEGKVRDLMDVEELLYCWRNLKCPVFVDLVSRFYGELCEDLFSSENEALTPNLQPSKR